MDGHILMIFGTKWFFTHFWGVSPASQAIFDQKVHRWTLRGGLEVCMCESGRQWSPSEALQGVNPCAAYRRAIKSDNFGYIALERPKIASQSLQKCTQTYRRLENCVFEVWRWWEVHQSIHMQSKIVLKSRRLSNLILEITNGARSTGHIS
jgi:hypothetical protein